MNGSLFVSNLAVYSLQIGALVALAAAVPAAVRMRSPGGRLVYWHIVLIACMALPLVRPWRQEVITVATPRDFPWGEAGMWALAAGAAVRLLWLATGLWRLRRYRLHSQPFDTAYDADIRVSADVASPVTFGVLNPVILVPEHFADLPEAMRQA